jgi:histidinol-phosphate/aromatic aminotransferase/cobyric acid decarboxylase-like protein
LPTQANFFCCQVTRRFTSAELTRRLLVDYNIIVKDCDSKTTLEGCNMIRLSIRNEADNNQLVKALKELEEE